MGKNLDYFAKRKIVFGMLIFLGITLLCLVTNLFSFYKSFLIGTFGLITYPAIVIAMVFCILYISNKVIRFDKKVLTLSIAVLCLFLCILQMALTSNLDFSSFSAFIGDSYASKQTPAGALFSILIFPFKYLLFDIGAYIVFAIAIVALVAYMIDMYYDRSKSKVKTVGAKIESFDGVKKNEEKSNISANQRVTAMGLNANVDRVSAYGNQNYANANVEKFDNANNFNNAISGQDYSSTSNESIYNGTFDKNGNNMMENYQIGANGANVNYFGENQSGENLNKTKDEECENVTQEDKNKLLSNKAKAKLGLIDNYEDLGDEEDEEDYADGKSEAFRLLYPQKCKGKSQNNYGGKVSYNSINRYFDNSSTKGKKVDDEEYRAKYREYTNQNFSFGYNNLNTAVSGGGSAMDGIISGDEYRSKNNKSSSKYANNANSSIFSDKDKQKTDEVFGGMKADLNLHKKVVSKRMGDGLIMTDVVESFSEEEATSNFYTGENVSQIEKFGEKYDYKNDYNVNTNLNLNSNQSGGFNDNGLNFDGIISGDSFDRRKVATTNNQNNFNNANVISGNNYLDNIQNNIFAKKTTAKNSENCIKSNVQNDENIIKNDINHFDNVGNAQVDFDSEIKQNDKNQILPILKVEGEEVAINEKDLTQFEIEKDVKESEKVENNEINSVNESFEEPEKEVENNSYSQSATILPKSDNLAINVECETENAIDDDKLIDTFDEISLTPTNHYSGATYDDEEGVQNQISGGSSDYSGLDNAKIEEDFSSYEKTESVQQEQESESVNNEQSEKIASEFNENEAKENKDASNQDNGVKDNADTVASVESRPLKSIFEKENKHKEELEKANVPYIPPKPYNHPPVEFLTVESTDMSDLVDDTEHKSQVLEDSLESFKVPAKVSNVVIGPTVTRYEMTMPAGISVRKIVNCADDIAMSLAAKGGIRIEAPIPGKNAVGIEVPNDKRASIGFKEVFESGEFYKDSNPLNFVLGKDINGKFIFCNLAKAPHLLVAGSTGSGKSVCLNILILSIIYKSSPEDVRLVLVDPKRVEFAIYEGLPHLMLPNIITEPEKTVNTFTWAINEMEKRYTLFQSYKVRDIGEYNQLPDIVAKKKPKMPYVVIIVDELADLMTVCKKEIEDKIARIAAKARSAGIHLVLATQRPSIDVITGTIKNNFPTRIAFSLTSYADSKTILDQGGAEKLLGRGDMLYAPQDQNEPTRIQAPFVTGAEINSIVDYVKAHNDSVYEDNIVNKMLNKGGGEHKAVGVKDPCEDEMFIPALRVVIENNQASPSLLQRKLSLGWNRASKLTDAMEDMGYITRPDTNSKRQILITKEQFMELYGDLD